MEGSKALGFCNWTLVGDIQNMTEVLEIHKLGIYSKLLSPKRAPDRNSETVASMHEKKKYYKHSTKFQYSIN